MPIPINLRPSTIAVADYEIAQSPALGSERDVWLTAKPSLVLGIATMSADGVVAYEYINAQMSKRLTGTVSKTAASAAVVGVGTKFLTEVQVGDRISIPGVAEELKEVTNVADDLNITVASNFTNSGAAQVGTLYPANPIVCFVITECKADEMPVITLGDLTGDLKPAEYAQNQSFNFAATRGVELTGPGTNLINALDIPTITKAKRGSMFGFVQLPKLSDFIKIGATRTRDITVPSKGSKAIASGLHSTRWVKPSKTSEGSLKITAIDLGDDDSLNRFRGSRCVAMVVTSKEEKIVTSRQFLTQYVPNLDVNNPEGDEEAMLNSEGMFQYMATLIAPGGG